MDERVPPLPPAPGGDTGSNWSGLPPASRAEPVGWPQPAAQPRPQRWPLFAAGAVALIAALAVFALLRDQSAGLPSQLAGEPRVASGPVAEVMGALDEMEIMGTTFDVAVYGDELAPSYVVMLIHGDLGRTDAGSLLATLPSGVMSQNGATVDFDRAIIDEIDGTEYVCVPATSDQATAGFGRTIAMCIYKAGDGVGMVMSFTQQDLRALLDVTKELQATV